MKYFKTIILKSSRLIAVFLALAVFIMGQADVQAVTENLTRIPDGLHERFFSADKPADERQLPRGPLRTTGAGVPPGPPGNQCGGTRNNFQYSWVSADSDGSVSKDLNEEPYSIPEDQDSISLRLNSVGGYCDSIITPSFNPRDGAIFDKTLRQTITNISGSPTVSVSYNGNPVSTGANVPDLDNKNVTVDYKPAYTENRRWATSWADIPYHQSFTLRGLSSLAPEGGNYRVSIAIPVKNVNHFPGGFAGDPSKTYVCVNGGGSTNEKGANCPTGSLVARLAINVQKAFEGTCFVNEINGTRILKKDTTVTLSPGEQFNARFTVFNGGTSNWDLQESSNDRVYLRSTDNSDDWGARTIILNGRGNILGDAALEAGENTGEFDGGTFRVPNDLAAGSTKTFSWIVFKDGPGGGRISAECPVDVEVKANQPFLRVSGGDVRAGAWFSDGTDLQCGVNQNNATAAEIKTSGYWGSSSQGDNLASFNGVSSSQYAVLATGLIGSTGNNNFAGNNAYPRESRKDLTLANTGNDGESYGNLYGGSSAYCQDVSKIITDSDGVVPADLGASEISGTKVYYQDSDLTISSPVRYIGSYADAGSIPNLVVIVRGNIYVESSVGQIDGTYIAIPDENGNGGIIDTCSSVGEPGEWPDSGGTLSTRVCDSPLAINGRLIAKNVIWKRTNGTVGSPSSVVDPSCMVFTDEYNNNPNAQSLLVDKLEECAAEFINMTPEVYFGSDKTDSSSSSNVSNVPVSSIELPPIY